MGSLREMKPREAAPYKPQNANDEGRDGGEREDAVERGHREQAKEDDSANGRPSPQKPAGKRLGSGNLFGSSLRFDLGGRQQQD